MAPVTKEKHPLQRTYLREWRDHHGMSQEDAAVKMDISRTMLSKIEKGVAPYSQRIMELASVAYDCTVCELICRNPKDPKSRWAVFSNIFKIDDRDFAVVASAVAQMKMSSSQSSE